MNPMRKLLLFCLSVLLCLAAFPVAAADAPPYCGIDVSRWQGDIDWKKTKAAGIDFAILRCYASGKDVYFDANYAGARAQDIALGAYVYMYATTKKKAVAEAENAVKALAGKSLTLPLFLDVEDKIVTDLGKKTLTDLMLVELKVFADAGYCPGIYTSKSFIDYYMEASRLTGYDSWIARWSCYTTNKNKRTYAFSDQDPYRNQPADCDLWQFSNGGSGSYFGVSSAYVDLNYCYTDYLESMRAPGLEDHEHSFETTVIAPTCTQPGQTVQTCRSCGETIATETAPALGHTEPDENGRCTRCGQWLAPAGMDAADITCPLCGQKHTEAFGWLRLIDHAVYASRQ